MRLAAPLLILLLATCGEEGGGNNAAPGPSRSVQTDTLTGLYESAAGEAGSRMCVLGDRFGLVVVGVGERSCSGAGTVTRAGDRLRIAMAGAESCTIEARIEGTRLSFAADQSSGCAYYCAQGARFAGATLVKIGGTEEDARRAQDLVGGRLCG
jgi:hypothetical protein